MTKFNTNYIIFTVNGNHFQVTPEFITKWQTTNVSPGSSLNNQVKLPLISGGQYNCTVYWGDGTISHITSWDQPDVIHTYTTPGEYTILIYGDCKGWCFDNSGDRLKLLELLAWGGGFKLIDGSNFYGCQNLQITATDIPDLSETTSLAELFFGCTSLTIVPNMTAWDVGHITNFEYLFADCVNFNQPLDSLDVSGATHISMMFSGCGSFNQPLNSWDVSSVVYMYGLFYGCTQFNQPLSSWDVSNVADMYMTFAYCTNYNQPLNSWNVGNVICMGGLFYDCTHFNQPLDLWNVSSVVDMQNMFTNCISFKQNLSSWNMTSIAEYACPWCPWGTVPEELNLGTFLYGGDINIAGTTTNYDAMLVNLANTMTVDNVTLNMGNSIYSAMVGKPARDHLINVHHWTIIDGGCPEAPSYQYNKCLINITLDSFEYRKCVVDTPTYEYEECDANNAPQTYEYEECPGYVISPNTFEYEECTIP